MYFLFIYYSLVLYTALSDSYLHVKYISVNLRC